MESFPYFVFDGKQLFLAIEELFWDKKVTIDDDRDLHQNGFSVEMSPEMNGGADPDVNL